MNKPTELELLAKRLYVAKAEQRAIDMATYGPNCYGAISLEECRIELGVEANSTIKENKQ